MVRPTVIGGTAIEPSTATPVTSVAAPTVFKPTAMPGATAPVQPAAKVTVLAPTAMPVAKQEPVAAPIDWKPAALPGVQRKPLDVSLEDLVRQFPQYEVSLVQGAKAILAGVYLDSINPATLLVFGKEPQEELADLIRKRLALAQRPEGRAVPQYLTRLQALLQNLVESFAGGLLRKGPEKVWAESKDEIQQLETALDAADDVLAAELAELSKLQTANDQVIQRLAAAALATEVLATKLKGDSSSLLLARLTSLTASQSMARDQTLHLAASMEQTQELTVLVQDGVVLKLPAVFTQLADITSRFNDTQRFQAIERISEIIHNLKQRKTS